ncbi:hypothetical protein NPIL_361461 [Nephila pilipes]|uniref:Uncharacterized protein n=1 Tax=Nephila pilipes TaxID=299642 RepID=A0A8X6PZ15_NEPPI|nr:hypothetical protein NPIL_361461 [Nephila pilipes]
MHVEHMATHGGFRPHHRLQAYGARFGSLENGMRPIVGVHRIQQCLTQRNSPIEGLGPVIHPSPQEQVVKFSDVVFFPKEIRVGSVPLLGQLFRILCIKLTRFNLHPQMVSHIKHMRRIVRGIQLFQVLADQVLVIQIEGEDLGRLQGQQTTAKVL